MQSLAQKVKFYTKYFNHFLNKIKLGSLPDGAMLCIKDIVCLYPKIPLGEGLASLLKFLETRDNKQISSYTFMEPAEVVLKSKIFEFDEKTFKQNHGPAIEISLHFVMQIFLWQILKENCWKILKRNQ